jgi:hypothetical protein
LKNDRPFVFAGLWEGWKDPSSGEWLRICTIITGDPNDLKEGEAFPLWTRPPKRSDFVRHDSE